MLPTSSKGHQWFNHTALLFWAVWFNFNPTNFIISIALMAKKLYRLDLLMVKKSLVSSRTRAQGLIGAGRVLVNGKIEDKAGHKYPLDSTVEVKADEHPFVSRGGLKLAHALEFFKLDLQGKVCMDTGASTGGFTDCMLQKGAIRVYAVDVGYGQLHWKLRNDRRVINIERTNIRYMERELVPEPVDFATVDTSFISLRIVIPAVVKFIRPEGLIVTLIKPQFEVGRENVGKKGVVRDPALHNMVLDELDIFFRKIGINPQGVVQSPIEGAKGNKEFLMLLKR